MKIKFFCDVALCCWLNISWRLEGS